ncbi:MAG: class I SAM-dependent methyltransferase [Actinomycetota bacterium]
MGKPARYLKNVRDQYEHYSFPKRDPEMERQRLIQCEMDMLARVNHYCFAGRQSFGPGFRALVAGGGTGDSAVFLAHQLAPRGGRVTYVDISAHSMSVAKQRAAIRGLDNIDWVHASILDLPGLGLGRFDYVNCVGVLHHMADPDEGLRSLAAVLAEDGAMGLMVYGRYGRMDIYATQDLMRLALAGERSLSGKVAAAKDVLQRLPPNNILLRGRDRAATLRLLLDDEPNLFDALLHEQDRSYTVDECYDFVEQAGLELVEFTNYHSAGGVCRLEYDPALYLDGLPVMERIRKMPRRTRQTIAEIINGSMGLHSFYAARRAGTVAGFDDPDMVPFHPTTHAVQACRSIAEAGRPTAVSLRFEVKLRLEPGPATVAMLNMVDGRTTLGEIRRRLGKHDRAALAADFDRLNALNFLMLRHKDADPVPIVEKTYAP